VGRFLVWFGAGAVAVAIATATLLAITPTPWSWVWVVPWFVAGIGTVAFLVGWAAQGRPIPLSGRGDGPPEPPPVLSPPGDDASMTFDMVGGSARGQRVESDAKKVFRTRDTDVEYGEVIHKEGES